MTDTLSPPKQLENVDFSLIRYANCWEDAEVLLAALQGKAGDRYMSIASAGDNSFSLLTQNPELVVAVDVSKVQLYLVELKVAAFRQLTHQDFIGFFGFKDHPDRKEIFEQIKGELKAETQAYWEKHIELIETGLVHQGKLEKFFQFFRKKVLPFIHSKKKVAAFYQERTDAEQEAFYDKKWNTWRWKLMFQFLFNKRIFGKYGRDPEFLKFVDTTVPKYFLEKTRVLFTKANAIDNHFLRYIMKGSFEDQLPHYAREENFDTIKANLDKLVIFEGLLDDALEVYTDINHFNLSNIFEYMDIPTFKQVVGNLLNKSAPDARFAYWNLMINRRFEEIFPEKVAHEDALAKELNAQDRGYFYNYFLIDRKQ